MDSYTIIVLIFGVLILFLLIILFFINKIIFYQNRIKHSLEVCFEHLDERKMIIQEMLDFLKQKLEMENTLIKGLYKITEVIDEVKKDTSKLKELKQLEKYYLDFCALDKIHSFLKKDEEYLALKEKTMKNQDSIIYAMDTYDKGVRNYNNYRISNKGISLISKIFRFQNYNYYNE